MSLPVTALPEGLLGTARRLREDLHRHPELGYQETRTAGVIAESLRESGLERVTEGVAETGVVGLLKGGRPGKTVALRADIDALPIVEETGLPYASENEGVMHACGHDGHTAILLAVARLLAGMRDDIAGNVKFLFQPAEEGGAGGEKMVQEGVLRDPDVDGIFALHCGSQIEAGRIEVSLTPNAAANGFAIKIIGKGAHGSKPHLSIDPIMIGTQIMTAAQALVTREKEPDRPLVLSFCAFHAGTKSNIIPASAEILGTIRAMDMETLTKVREGLRRIANGVAGMMRGTVEVIDHEIYPPVVNDPDMVQLVRDVGAELQGEGSVGTPAEQSMGGEDFAFYLTAQGGVPGCMFRLGVETDENLHTSRFDFGSKALDTGILMMTNSALRFLHG